MEQKIRECLAKYIQKEKLFLIIPVLLAALLTLWSAKREDTKTRGDDGEELGLIIPQGQLIVPLELANGQALSRLVQNKAVIDLFSAGKNGPVVKNLRIMKLQAGEGPLFGALVPEPMAGLLQNFFSQPRLKAALKTNESGPTQFQLPQGAIHRLEEVPVSED